MKALDSPRRPLGALSLNRVGQENTASNGSKAGKSPRKLQRHQSKASLEIGKDGRASIALLASPYAALAKRRSRAVTISGEHGNNKLFSPASGVDKKLISYPRRQSTTRVELDNVEALLRKYTQLQQEEGDLWMATTRAAPAPAPAPAAVNKALPFTPLRTPPMLEAPVMQRSGSPFVFQDAPTSIPISSNPSRQTPSQKQNPFPYSSLLDGSPQQPASNTALYNASSAFSTEPSSLSSSMSSSIYAQLPAPVEKLSTMIHDLQSFLPQASRVPQYKLDNLQQAIDQLLTLEDEGHAPQAFLTQSPVITSGHPGSHTPPQATAGSTAMMRSHQRRTSLPGLKEVLGTAQPDAAAQPLVFVYENGCGQESTLPQWQW